MTALCAAPLQGEANTADAVSASNYSCLFPQMITAWRQALQSPTLYFGFVQLSTWCAPKMANTYRGESSKI